MAPVGYTQTDRALRITTPLGPDTLLLRSIAGTEGISQLFRFQLDLRSEDDSINLSDLIGQAVTVHLERLNGEVCWHGHISRVSQGARTERFTHYRAEMVPWLWFLTRTADCRIFQKQTVPDIIQKIFEDLGFQNYTLDLHGPFREWEYCVQYRETDFNFVSRLMEEEGIYYYFQHEPDGSKHTLVLANSTAAHEPCPNQAKAYCETSSGGVSLDDNITSLNLEQEFRPSAWAHTDFNFKTPSTNLMVQLEEKPGYEIYDFPGSFDKIGDGDTLARARLQETVALENRATGSSRCRNFRSGYIVEVADHYRSDANKKWLLTHVHHQANIGGAYDGDSGGGEEFFYANTFECIPASVPFRAQRTTPKPFVQGCQSAIVTGPAGEEIHTDEYGRVKVQFHWDREGKHNEDSSCWIRVSQPWAGKDWGAISIPRLGQEVLVDFLEGDPDQPIIIGRVYNAESMPPYPLPAGAHNMGMKSKSIKGGGYNEISISDVNGTEGITMHAQYNMGTVVEHDQTTTVHNDRTETVDNNETITIHNNRTETVDVNETISIGSNRAITVGSNETVSVGANRTTTIGGNQSNTVSKNEFHTVALTRTQSTGINEMINVGAAQEVSVGGIRLVTVGVSQMVNVGMKHTLNAGNEIKLSSKKIILEASTELTLSCGGGTISINAAGIITIKGTMVKINS